MSEQIEYIWNPGAGITDYETRWEDLAASEIASVRKIWSEQQKRLEGTRQLATFNERLNREWAIETGIIENLYQIDRGITQTLIEHGFQAEFLAHGSTNKPASYVINLLRDQQDALEGVFGFIKQERELSTSWIKELHGALVRSQRTTEGQDSNGNLIQIPLIKGAWKVQPNYPSRDGVTFAYCPPEQVASEMDRLVELHRQHLDAGVSAEVEAAWLHHRFSQIHPFQDGNGRVCRALASLVLIRAGLFPLVVNRDDKLRYLDALEAADKGDLGPLVELIASLQRALFRKATALSENILAEGRDRDALLQGLLAAANRVREGRELELNEVFDYARNLEEDLKADLESLVPSIRAALIRVEPNANVFVRQSDETNGYFYRGQIIENAKQLDYYADFYAYCSWVSLNMKWKRKARLMFAFHGIGRPFSGSLACAPFFEVQDQEGDDDAQSHSAQVPVAREPFVFFYNEEMSVLRERFGKWRDDVVKVAVTQLMESL